MEKKICAYLFGLTFIALSTVVHGQPDDTKEAPTVTPSVAIERSPSVEPVSEIDIEDVKLPPNHPGYNFAETEKAKSARVPANILSKASEESQSYAGPIIFLIALPIGLWIVVSRKFSSNHTEEKRVDYYPKTQQFKPYTTDYQKSEEDDDIDFPKAS